MKIALLANDTTYTYNLRKEIIQRFIADGNSVVIVAEKLLFTNELEAMGCRLVDVQTGRHGTNPFSDLKLLSLYKKILRSEKPDAVISYNIKPNSYGGVACKDLKIPYYPNITGLGTPLEHPSKIQKLATFIYKQGVSGATCIFFQNEANRKFFKEHGMIGKNSRTRLLPGSGVDLDAHPVLPYPSQDEKIHFLFVARVMKQKGIDYFLAAAKAVKKERDDCVFDICGYCDDEEYLKILKDAEEQGIVAYHGQQKDMKPFFKECSCLVHPSYYPEGMSNVLLEAASSGRPIIAADRPGCRETVDDGKTGFVVPVKNKQAVIDAVHKILNMSRDEREAMGLAGRRKMEKEFDRQLVVDAYAEEVGEK